MPEGTKTRWNIAGWTIDVAADPDGRWWYQVTSGNTGTPAVYAEPNTRETALEAALNVMEGSLVINVATEPTTSEAG